MGICDSSSDDKNENNSTKTEIKDIKINTSDISSMESNKNDKFKINSLKDYNYKNSEEISNKLNICPKLDKYERSFGKKSETSQNNLTKSEFSSNITEGEIIIKGEINKNCQNKEKDFDNNSFMKLIKNNGGIILKEDLQNKSQRTSYKLNNINGSDTSKENISEIKSHNSFNTNRKSKNSNFSFINGKKGKIYLKSELNTDKITNYSIKERMKKKDINTKSDNKSIYSNKTINPKIDFNKYLNEIFIGENFKNNNNNQFILGNNNILKLNQGNIPNNIQKTNFHYNEKKSLHSNHNNVTDDSTNEDLIGSFIGIPKIDERIPESDLNFGYNYEDIISNLSS